MTFRSLAEPLRPIAERTAQHLRTDRGLPSFKIEQAFDDEVDRPTLHCVTRDHHTLCVEICEGVEVPGGVEKFTSECVRLGLPVRLYLAVHLPDATAQSLDKILKRAEQIGIGVIEVTPRRVLIRREPVSLSLSGLRPIDRRAFPHRYRQMLADAEATFRNGNPVKGCLVIYEAIEQLTRRLAKRTYEKALWQSFNPTTKPYAANFETGAWASILKQWMRDFDGAKTSTVTEALLARCIGITPARNDSGHAPRNARELRQRNARLRTRFEEAVDLFLDVVKAAAPHRV